MSLNDQLLHAHEHPSPLRRVGGVVGVVVVVLMVALTVLAFRALRMPPTTSGLTAAPPTTPVARAGVHSTIELEARLITAPSLAYVQVPDSIAKSGPSDRAKAVRDDGGSGAAAALTRARFVRGYQRMWGTPSRDLVGTIVYQFESTTGARSYGTRMRRIVGQGTHGLRLVAVPGRPAAVVGVVANRGKFVAAVIRTSGPFLIDIECAGGNAAAVRRLAIRLAADQARLVMA